MAWAERRGDRWRGAYRDPEGVVRKTATVTSKKKAEQAAADEEAKVRAGTWFDAAAGRMLFRDYFHREWFPNRGGERTTRDTYLSHYNAALGPKFGDMELRRILRSTVQGWVAEMERAGVKPSTIKARVKALQTVLAAKEGASAMSDGFIQRNPCADVKLPTVVDPDVQIYTPAEVNLILEQMDPWWRVLALMGKETGFRWGELLGLTTLSFGVGFRTVTARRTVIETKKEHSGNGSRFAWKDYPKGKKYREVGIRAEAGLAIQTLIAERELGPGDRLFSMPDRTPPPEWHPPLELIWTPRRTDVWPEGEPISRAFWRQSVWVPAIEAAGLPYKKFHVLRGSHISWLLAGGADLATVMDRAGHREFETTRRYVGRMPDADKRALDALDKTLGAWS